MFFPLVVSVLSAPCFKREFFRVYLHEAKVTMIPSIGSHSDCVSWLNVNEREEISGCSQIFFACILLKQSRSNRTELKDILVSIGRCVFFGA